MFLDSLKTKVLAGSLAGSLILSGALGVGLAVSLGQLSSAKEVIRDLTSWQATMIGSVELATGSPKLTPDAAILQLAALGQAHSALKLSVDKSNKAVADLEQKTADAKVAQQKEALARAQAVAQAHDLQSKLEEQAKTTVPADQVEARIRTLQDELYEAGI